MHEQTKEVGESCAGGHDTECAEHRRPGYARKLALLTPFHAYTRTRSARKD